MNIREKVRGAVRRMAGVSVSPVEAGGKRRTVALPSILNTYGPRADAMPKPTVANLRRFAETPVARRAINTIKDRIAGMRWRVQA
nr:phage portal protein [Terriglobales bacterium]